MRDTHPGRYNSEGIPTRVHERDTPRVHGRYIHPRYMDGIYTPGYHGGLYTPGYHGRLYTPGTGAVYTPRVQERYIHPGYMGGICTPVPWEATYPGTMGGYLPRYHGGYSTPLCTMVGIVHPCIYTSVPPWVYPSHDRTGVRCMQWCACSGERALGSDLRLILIMRRIEPWFSLKV